MTVHIVRRTLAAPPPDWPTDFHPVLARVYLGRGVRSARELQRSLGGLQPFTQLRGIDAAVDCLQAAIRGRQRMLVVGDFDVDGATSSALAVRALRAFGAAAVDYLVPNRFEFGYGLTPEIVTVARARDPDLIITVDNGISSVAGVAAANAAGIAVLVTDHHLPGASLPAAAAIVNPNQPGCAFPSKHLAGVGVVFYLLSALRARLRADGWFGPARPEPNLAQWLDLVALGTVADVVPLDCNNRILVGQGLARIRAGHACPGIQALLEVAGRRAERLVAADLGFAVGPRLNAAGRLTDMSLGIECLLCDDLARARALAGRLDALNRERRAIEAQMRDEALAAVAALPAAGADVLGPLGVCLFDPGWHQGVVGLVASRLKERLHRPVIAFAPGRDGDLRGSARSVVGVHIRDVLDSVAARHPGLVSRFGGHAMAAGLTLPAGHLEAFSAAFDAEVRRHLAPEAVRGVVHSDGALCAEDFTLELAEALREGGPWGQGFPEPVFDGRFEVVQHRWVGGDQHLRLSLRATAGGRPLDAIAFHAQSLVDGAIPTQAELVYRLDVNDYQGRRALQLVVDHLRPV